MSALRLRAPAKINLALEVTGRRPDGYHDIDTVMTTIDLADDLRLSPARALEVVLSGAESKDIDPVDDLSGRAARALAVAAGREPAVRIEVTKRIPSPAGLGGGSSDAAAVLRGLNVLWGLDWPLTRLSEAAATVGSDVPFFLHGGAARCTGRGEVVEPLRDLRPLRLLILVPPVGAMANKTARRYGALTPHDFTDGHRSWRLSQRLARGAPPPTNDLVNVFETVVERTDAELLAHYASYRAAGAPQLHLCGAGPAVYVFVHEGARVADLRRGFEALGARVLEARTLPRAAAQAIAPEP
ncbi:MAG: 4-(cytidine 5'-diphospho)-2-C-methyl-D-erythritol kinase [Dehalococcoidia bacterium]|nr:4-(cytidine 5'-diphospho)-2-C-methyl-D-erythritol kinase [Dehalococcoidia bacterium]